jgi:hypothetical protein
MFSFARAARTRQSPADPYLVKSVLDMGESLYKRAQYAQIRSDGRALVPDALDNWTAHILCPILNTMKDWLNACQTNTDLEGVIKGILTKGGAENIETKMSNTSDPINRLLLARYLPNGLDFLWRLFTRDPQSIEKAMGSPITDVKAIDAALTSAREVLKELGQDIEKSLSPQRYLSPEAELDVFYDILHKRFPNFLPKQAPVYYDRLDKSSQSQRATLAPNAASASGGQRRR